MFPVKRLLQLSMLALVLTSGIVLGLSQGNLELTLVAAIGGISGYVIADWLRVFQLRGLIANLASILVLFYAMRNFVGTDGAAKLICVSNLLAEPTYLWIGGNSWMPLFALPKHWWVLTPPNSNPSTPQ